MQILIKIDGEIDSDYPLSTLSFLLADVRRQLTKIEAEHGKQSEEPYPLRLQVDYAASRIAATVDLGR